MSIFRLRASFDRGLFVIALIVSLLALAAVTLSAPVSALGTPPQTPATSPSATTASPSGKVGICHSTGSATNPYVHITVSVDAAAAHVRHGDVLAATATGCPGATPTPTPTPTPTVPPTLCNTGPTFGGLGTITRVHQLGRSSGTFTFSYESYLIPNQFDVIYQGAVIYSEGALVSGAISVPLTYSGTATEITVVVTGPAGTAWNYYVGCSY